MKKKGIAFTFGWLFAILIGAAILFLAIYATVQLVGTERAVQETEAAKQLELILTPVETGYEEGKSVPPIIFPTETRIYNNCSTRGNFGEQNLRIEDGEPITSYNKYIFSPSAMESRELYAFSKPFDMGFKIANLLFLWDRKYCFVSAPSEIEREVRALNLPEINTTDNINECENGAEVVCFFSELEKCDTVINPIQKTVRKGNRMMFYKDSLVYGAIFSEPGFYECEIQRLMKRTSELAFLYNEKSKFISARSDGCSSELQPLLETLGTYGIELNNSRGLVAQLDPIAKELAEMNERMTACKLWEDN